MCHGALMAFAILEDMTFLTIAELRDSDQRLAPRGDSANYAAVPRCSPRCSKNPRGLRYCSQNCLAASCRSRWSLGERL